jgi:iron complex outermembrane recepter protein
VYVRNSASSVKATNISRARVEGDELSLRLAAGAAAALSTSVTWTSSVDQGAAPAWRGRTLPQRPDREAYARLDLARGRMRAAVDVHAIGRNYLDRYNLHVARSRALVGASLSCLLAHRDLRVVVEGKNLGDRRVADVGGFPLPGRSLFVSCQAHVGAVSSRSSNP